MLFFGLASQAFAYHQIEIIIRLDGMETLAHPNIEEFTPPA